MEHITIEEAMVRALDLFSHNNKVLYQGTNIDGFVKRIYKDRDLDLMEPIYKDYYRLMPSGLFKVCINDTIYEYELPLRYDVIILDRINLIDTTHLDEWVKENKDEYRHLIITTGETSKYSEEYFIKKGFKVSIVNFILLAVK